MPDTCAVATANNAMATSIAVRPAADAIVPGEVANARGAAAVAGTTGRCRGPGEVTGRAVCGSAVDRQTFILQPRCYGTSNVSVPAA